MDILKGFGSEGSLISILLSAFIIWHLYIRPRLMKTPGKDRRKPGNPNDKPGNAEVCKDHMRELAEIKMDLKNLRDGFNEHKKNDSASFIEVFRQLGKIGVNKNRR
jgi:hypothetical protein